MAEEILDVFNGISKKPGLQIWTINNIEMVPVPVQAFGNFFEGDCYIVLYGSEKSTHSMQIHFWIGNSSSQDEQGAVAIYVTQLSEYLGGSPVQYREVQGNESPQFRSYFKTGLIYKRGGVASGLHHVESNVYNILRLLHVKGRKHVTATEVELSWISFNTGDVFLLDLGKAIVQWNGPESNRSEKLKAVLLAQDIRDRERGGRAQIGVVEGSDEEDSPELMKIMMAVLGPRTGHVREAAPDETLNMQQIATIRLYRVFESSGELVIQEVATQPLTQDLLQSSDCYIVDQGGVVILVWKGNEVSKDECRTAVGRAVEFIKAKNYPSSTRVVVMEEGGETAMFTHLFKSWRKRGETQSLAKVDQVKFDVMELHARTELAAQQRMVDDASGKVQVWRIENLELRELHPSSYGQFNGGDCYLVLYTYKRSSHLEYIIYMWQGRYATQDEITACASQAINIDNKYNGAPVQVRVVMGKEPRHFMAIFKGKLIIFEGGTGRPGVANPDPSVRMFQVRGTNELNTKATEVPARASCLNTNDVFLLKTDHIFYLWYGKGCSGDEREMGKAVSEVLSKQEKQAVTEGQEPAEFWVALGGKAPYAGDKRLEREEPLHSPVMIECSKQTGHFHMTEVIDFAQSDLDEDDIILLDTWEEIFLWIGSSASEEETKEASNRALEYLIAHPAGRDSETPITTVKQGHEPPTFTGWFNAWDPHKWSGGKSYEDMKKGLGDVASISLNTHNLNSTNPSKNLVKRDVTVAEGGYDAHKRPVSSSIYIIPIGGSPSPSSTPGPIHSPPFEDKTTGSDAPLALGSILAPELLLKKTPSELPQGVDPNSREDYLSDADFENLLGCSRLSFQRLPKWRQNDLKKKAGLF